jgi:hypothetical protein
MTRISFWSFGRRATGKVITHVGNYCVVQSRNPYGTHNLVVVESDHNGCGAEAIRHGSAPSLLFVQQWLGRRAYRRVRKHLASRGVGLDWVVAGSGDE